MEFVNLVCTNCGGTDFQKLSDLEHKCNHCHGLLVRTSKAVPVPPAAPPAPIPDFKMPEFPGFAKVLAITMGVIFLVVCVAVLIKSGPKSRPEPGPIVAGPGRPSSPTPTPALPKLKVEMVGKASDRFGDNFIKCTVTNLSDVVIIDPYVKLTLYKNDVKLNTISGDAKLKYLKPGVTVPIWASVGKHTDYTRAEIMDYEVVRSISNTEGLFPQFNYLDAAMKVETGISTFNDQPYKEKFYEVSGTIENDRYEKARPVLFVIFYNAKGEIVGAETANPVEMKRGEKVSFDVSAGDTQLYGTPVRYEIMAVDPTRSNGVPCLANMTC